MTIKVGSVYNVRFNSGNTHTAFSWPSKIPDSGNKYMKNKVIHITKKLNPKDSLDYDYVGDIYDSNDDAIELKNIKIVSKQLILKSSTFPVPGRKKASGKGKKSKKRTKKRTKKSKRKSKKYKRSSRKTRRSYIKKTRKRKMRGGTDKDAKYSFNNLERVIIGEEIMYSFNLIDSGGTPPQTVVVKYGYIKEMCHELVYLGELPHTNDCNDSIESVEKFLNKVLSDSELRRGFFYAIGYQRTH